jgi:flagellar biosynthetic protein FliR
MTDIAVVLTPERVITGMLVAARLGGVMAAAPVFGHQGMPVRVRLGITLATAVGMAAHTRVGATAAVEDVPTLAGLLVLEFGAGILLGLAAELVFTGIVMGGQLAGVHMGLGIADVIDPRTHLHATPIALWLQFVALQVFLAIDGHHLLLRAVMQSFELVPPGRLHVGGAGVGELVMLVGGAFEIAVRIAAPVLAGLLITETGMGLLARAIPQLNVFVTGFAVKIVVGFLILGAAMPFIARFVGAHLGELDGTLVRLLGALS